jgi:A/G-specific adenine glycosylase
MVCRLRLGNLKCLAASGEGMLLSHQTPSLPLRAWVRRKLLTWFARYRRDLPWRQTRDAYAIWVSEIMLQQTQVATVIPFFQRFLETFPTVQHLAAADEQQVLRLWEGLGYYRRARSLHQAARQFAATGQEQLPNDPELWRQLPGIGRYTLGAVLSQAFDRRLPILEANSVRLLCRFFGIEEAPEDSTVQKQLWQLAEVLLPRRRVGDFNQALMELGALVCTPTKPSCLLCPLAQHCTARSQGRQDELPRRPQPPATLDVQEVAVVVRRGSNVLVVQRPATGRWANLWEFPHTELQAGESHHTAAQRLLRETTNLVADLGRELITLTHTITRFRITLVCQEASWQSGEFGSTVYQQGRWVRPAELGDLPFSSPQRRLAGALGQATRQNPVALLP